MEKLPLGMDEDSITDEISRGGPKMFTNNPAERLRRQVQPLCVVGGGMQGVEVLLDQITQLDEHRMPEVIRPRYANTGLGCLESCGENQQHLQVSEHDLAKGKVVIALLLPNAFDQVRHFDPRLFVQRDDRDAVGVVEQDATATDFSVERLDAEEVGVKLDDLAVDRRGRDEADVLIRD